MEQQIKTVKSRHKISPTPTNKRTQRLKSCPLTGLQEGLLFHTPYSPQTAVYVDQAIVQINEIINLSHLKNTLQALIAHHEILRASFNAEQAKQFIHPHVKLDLLVLDFSRRRNKQQLFKKFLKDDQATSFAIHKPPLHRFALIKLAKSDYRLVLSYHHILIGGATAPLLIKEIFDRYAGIKPNTTKQTYQSYVNFVKNIEQQAANPYWKKLLQGFDSPVNLPKIRSHAAKKTLQQKTWQVPMDLVKALNIFAHTQSLTVNILCQAAWGLLLARYTGLDDIVFGNVRELPRPITKGLAGLFINTLPIRIKIHEKLTVNDLLQHILYQHKMQTRFVYTPLQELNKATDLPTGTSLITTLFDYKPQSPNAELKAHVPSWAERKLSFNSTKHYPLNLEIYGESSQLFGKLSYSTEFFDTASIKRLIGHYQMLLQGIISDVHRSVVNLPLLTEAEWQQQIIDWNDTTADYPHDKTISQLFEAQVVKTPDRTAVTFADSQLTYHELNEKANQLAHSLRKQNVKPDTLVAICLERGLEMIIGIIGILKAGGAYVPIDPHYPDLRIQYMLEDSNAGVLLTEQTFKSRLQALRPGINTICLDAPQAIFTSHDKVNLTNINTPQDLAYVIYTSGSTGKPKGACIAHQSLVNRIHWMQQNYQLTVQDKILHKTPFSFDVSVWEYCWPLITGARLVIAKPEIHKDPHNIIQCIADLKITVIHFVPSMLQAFLEFVPINSETTLRHVFLSGETLPFPLQQLFFKKYPKAKLHNLYGPTEATIDVTYWPCQKLKSKSTSIGKPIANTQIFIFDQYYQPVPVGIKGEIYIGGVGLARNYLNRAELTQQKFIIATNIGSQRLYRTGDIGSWSDDGNIIYHGRFDDQIKLRGLRIELGEIEKTLLEIPSIKQAVVVAQHEAEAKQLIAYIVAHEEETPSFSSINNHLKQKLPSYMQPNRILLIKDLPTTPSGKVDKTALLALLKTNFIKNIYPLSKTETIIARIWAKALNLNPIQINPTDDFFQLGGNSLTAIKIINEVKNKFDLAISTNTFIKSSNISSLATFIDQSNIKYANNTHKACIDNTSDLIPLTNSNFNSKPSIFFIHPIGGTVFCYIALANYLSQKYSCYAIQDPAASAFNNVHFRSIPDMAAYYLRLIRQIQPEGEYILIGHSFGGTLAFEIAHQLIQKSAKIHLLALLDTWALFSDRFAKKENINQTLMAQYKKNKSRLINADIQQCDTWLDIFKARTKLGIEYSPPTIDCNIALFKASKLLPEFKDIADPNNHWQKYSLRKIQVHMVDGNHESILEEPNVQKLANKINSLLLLPAKVNYTIKYYNEIKNDLQTTL